MHKNFLKIESSSNDFIEVSGNYLIEHLNGTPLDKRQKKLINQITLITRHNTNLKQSQCNSKRRSDSCAGLKGLPKGKFSEIYK